MSLREVAQKYNIHFKKALGQNLLLDDNINRIMVDAAALTAGDSVIEVGAGLGALTVRMQPRAGRILAIEIDASFIPCLEDQFRDCSNVVIFRGDVLNHDPRKLAEEFIPGAPIYKVVANLPYYITTPILFHFWESALPLDRLVIMVQEEVAHRLTAAVDSPEYSVISLAAQFHAEVDIVHHVPATCFVPRPKVESCIVRLRSRRDPLFPDVDRAFLFKIIRAAFLQRRKTLRNALTKSGAYGAPKEITLEALEEAGVDPGRRAQTVSLHEFAAIARCLKAKLEAARA
ncbi:MAG: ribosomal RNA small subunit methyltransferase A [Candidatus Hydrogenedentota bacterium]